VNSPRRGTPPRPGRHLQHRTRRSSSVRYHLRAQRVGGAHTPPDALRAGWRRLRRLAGCGDQTGNAASIAGNPRMAGPGSAFRIRNGQPRWRGWPTDHCLSGCSLTPAAVTSFATARCPTHGTSTEPNPHSNKSRRPRKDRRASQEPIEPTFTNSKVPARGVTGTGWQEDSHRVVPIGITTNPMGKIARTKSSMEL